MAERTVRATRSAVSAHIWPSASETGQSIRTVEVRRGAGQTHSSASPAATSAAPHRPRTPHHGTRLGTSAQTGSKNRGRGEGTANLLGAPRASTVASPSSVTPSPTQPAGLMSAPLLKPPAPVHPTAIRPAVRNGTGHSTRPGVSARTAAGARHTAGSSASRWRPGPGFAISTR